MAKEPDIANPYDYPDTESSRKQLFLLSFGAYGWTRVYVWADHLEDAFEEGVEWLDREGHCGIFVTLTIDDIIAAAEDLAKDKGWSRDRLKDAIEDLKAGEFDGDAARALEMAEMDLTVIGHTTLTNCEKKLGTGPLYIPSWEWGVSEIPKGDDDYDAVLAESEEIAEED